MDIEQIIRALHREAGQGRNIPPESDIWPASWKKIEYKEYPRFDSYTLPKPTLTNKPFGDIVFRRKSERNFDRTSTVSSKTLSNFLYTAAGISENRGGFEEKARRTYPSGGARYPLELYFSFQGNQEIEQGVYHYNIKKHSLELLLKKDGDERIRALPTYPWVKDAAVILLVTAVFERSARKYGVGAHRYTLLESGAVLQNFYLAAVMENLGCCAIGNDNDVRVEEILDLNTNHESFIVMCAVGPTLQTR